MKLPEIDGERIHEIIARVRDLASRGAMDRDTWLSLNRDFSIASHGRLEMPNALSESGKSEWFGLLRANSASKRTRKPRRAA